MRNEGFNYIRARNLGALLVLLSCLTACSSSTQTHPRDPIEPVNRAVYRFNDKADQWVIKPVAEGYRAVTPVVVRSGVDNFFNNLGDASSALNYGLQARLEPSFYSFARFLLNSTAGLLGVMDVTGEGGQRRFQQTGFGDTLAVWGWKNSSYLVLPLLGPSTVRDGTAALAGMSFQQNLLGNPGQATQMGVNILSGVTVAPAGGGCNH